MSVAAYELLPRFLSQSHHIYLKFIVLYLNRPQYLYLKTGRAIMQSDYDNSLQSYFTDMERPRDMFKNFVSAEKLPKRLIVFHGVGGVGKSSLLRMFRLHCKSENIPVALASGDDAKSVLDVITRWTEDFKENGIKFLALSKTLESYRAIEAKVEDQVKKSQNKVADIASKAASKTAETAGGALLGAAIGSVIPGVGTAIGGALGGVVSGMGAEALVDWLRGFLTKPDIDLLLDPAKKLSEDFLKDVAKTAEKKRIVLLLDTFEQMSALEDWVGETAQKIHPNILMIIAGRKLPDWNRVWSSWMMNAQVEELKPMTEGVMRELIHRYYATMRGGQPDSMQVEAIIRFARGLPMVVTSAVQLWVKYGVEDFQSVKAEIVANLVDRLTEGVPSALIPALEAAAVVRWFDQPILRAVMDKDDVREVYNELRRFPFVRTRAEGLALHDSVREMMDENLRVQDSERHAELHERAAVYFEKRLEKITGDEAVRLGLERLYHRVRANEETGVKIFQEMAEELTRYRLVNRLRDFLNEVSAYPLELENSINWRNYYNAVLFQFKKQPLAAEDIFNMISQSENLEAKLRAYALCELGKKRNKMEFVKRIGGLNELINTVKRSNELLPSLDIKRAENYMSLGIAYPHTGEIEKSAEAFEKAIALYEERKDLYGVATVFLQLMSVHGIRGDWARMQNVRSRGLDKLDDALKNTITYSTLISGFGVGQIMAGRFNEAEQYCRESLSINKKIGIVGNTALLADLGLSLGLQAKYEQSHDIFKESIERYRNLYEGDDPVILNFRGMVLLREGKFSEAEDSLLASLTLNNKMPPRRNPPENLHWLGLLHETKHEWKKSEEYNSKSLEYRWIGRQYYICAALTSLIRVKHAQRDIAAIPSLLAEAEQLAQQYEYNDHLTSLRLTQGHLAWENGNRDEVIALYQKAMVYALRYNRFLLDELISGRPQGTLLRPIIPYCLENGDSTRKILHVLVDWWKTGVNDIGTLRPDTISPIPEGIPLLEAEKIAREREPGDGSMRRTVVEQFEIAINR